MTSPRAAARREAILEAALEAFTERGYAAATMEDIASRAGITRVALYGHVPNKAALLEELLGVVRVELKADLARALEGVAEPEARIAAVVRTTFAFQRRRRALLHAIHSASSFAHVTSRRPLEGFVELVAAVIADGVRSGVFRPASPFVLAELLAGMIFFESIRAHVPYTDEERAQSAGVDVAELVLETFLHGVRTPPEGA